MKKTFGEHLEDGLTGLGNSISRTVIEARNHELEYIKSGWTSDEEKLRMLKRDLYEAARCRNSDPQHIQNLRSAISTIGQQLEADRNHRNSPIELISSILNSIILLGLVATFLSFPTTWSCNLINNHSQACQVSRVIPTSIFTFFSE